MNDNRDLDRLERQADALDRHERLIARHTAIQSWTNILSLLVAVVTTIALGYIAYIQYKTSERQVALEYARSSNRYVASVIYKTADGRLQDETTEAQPAVPFEVRLERTRGDSTIRNLYIWQEIILSEGDQASGHGLYAPAREKCRLLVTNWFLPQSGIERDIRINPLAEGAFAAIAFTGADGTRLRLSAGKTLIFIETFDVFGNEVSDVIDVSHDYYTVEQENIEGPRKDYGGVAATLTQASPLTISRNRAFEANLGGCEGLLTDTHARAGE